jgi:uncharacterized protein
MRTAITLILIVASLSYANDSPQTHMVPMRDGTRLATDVYLPANHTGPLPVVLARSTYNKNGFRRRANAFARRGYAFVAQDTRGRFASEGRDSAFLTDGMGPNRDGYDTIEWITRQEWCDGNVGMLGGSALGITSYLAAATGHPALKAAVVMVAAGNLYHDALYPGGVYRKAMVDGWVKKHGSTHMLPFVRAHAVRDSTWDHTDLTVHAPRSPTSIYHWGGWFDCFMKGTIGAFQSLQERGGEGARGRQVLVVGPWAHGRAKAEQGELVFPGDVAGPDVKRERYAWFDSRLKGELTSADSLPVVRYFLMGDVDDSTTPGNVWMSSSTWPPPESVPTPYYLGGDSALTIEPPAERESPDAYDYDPRNPSPTRGGQNLRLEKGPYDQRMIEARPDVLTFTTAPLESPVAIAGPVRVRLFASSSAKDTDFMARLCDVYPDGRSMLLVDGAIRGRFRKSFAREEFLTPGRVYEFEIDLWHMANVFNRGHRIRVSITSSNAPKFQPNPNTATPFLADTIGVTARNTIYHDREHPSAIILPVMRVGR